MDGYWLGWVGLPSLTTSCTSREQLIEECMAKMPQMIENWRRQQQARREKAQADNIEGPLQGRRPRSAWDTTGPEECPLPGAAAGLEKQHRKRLKEEKQRKKKEARKRCDAAAAAAQDPADSETPNS